MRNIIFKMLKSILIVFSIISIDVTCKADSHVNKQEIPDNVTKSFSEQYPQIHVKKWKIKSDTNVAEFRMSKMRRNAFYLSNGTWIKTETIFSDLDDLPIAVINSWHQCAFQTWYIQAMKEIEFPNQNLYVIKVTRVYSPQSDFSEFSYAASDRYSEIYELYFNKEGSLLKKVQLN